LPAAQRAAEVKNWQWSKDGGADADGEKTFLADFKSTVVSTWQGKHSVFCPKKYWEDHGAETMINVDIAEGAQGAADHMKMNAFKVPKTMHITNANVDRTDNPTG